MSTTITITRQNRTIGYGITSTPEEWIDMHGQTHLRIESVDRPGVTGTVRTVLVARPDEMRGAGAYGGTHYREAFFVGGRRIVGDAYGTLCDLEMLAQRQCDSVEVEVEVEA